MPDKDYFNPNMVNLLNNICNKAGNILQLLTIILFFGYNSNAQVVSNTEIGIMGGTSYYLGEINNKHFDYVMPCGGLVIRNNIDRRIVLKGEFMAGSVRADDSRNSNDTIKFNRNLHFRSSIYELSGQIEFNFLPYETGNPLYPFTPFIFAGVSLFKFNPKAEATNGEWVDLQPLGTEGQGTTSFQERKKYALTQLSIPMGGGFKISINKTFNIILEYGIRKTFTDYLDDVSTTYTGGNLIDMSPLAIDMSDKSLNGPQAKNFQRGNSKDNDWYSFAGITLSFKILSEKERCNY